MLAIMPNLDPAPVSYTHSAIGGWVGDRRLVCRFGHWQSGFASPGDPYATFLAGPYRGRARGVVRE